MNRPVAIIPPVKVPELVGTIGTGAGMATR